MGLSLGQKIGNTLLEGIRDDESKVSLRRASLAKFCTFDCISDDPTSIDPMVECSCKVGFQVQVQTH